MFEDKNAAEAHIKELIENLFGASCENSKDGKCDYSEDSLQALKRLSQVVPVWGIESVPVDIEQIDRKSNMFGAKPFTSEKYPWPYNSKNKPYYPLAQIDLMQISEVTGKDFGSGLLQVWLDITKNNLDDLIRIIDQDDSSESLTDDAPETSVIQKIDEFNTWFGIASQFSYKFLGYMMADWFDGALEWEYDRDLSDKEIEILDVLEKLSESNGYKSTSGNWLLGYPDKGSGAPAGKYYPEPRSLIQFSGSGAFPLIHVSRYANIFYSGEDGDVSYFFDWNG